MHSSAVVVFSVVIVVYLIISKYIFEKIYATSTKIVIDEEFHLNLGEKYCEFRLDSWDPKVTTLPGLYIVSAIFLGPLGLCSTYWLRFTSFIASAINLLLFYVLICLYNGNKADKGRHILSAINLALLPPLYFFSNLYYTDVISLTMILALMVASETGHHYLASIFGFSSIIMRQTNVIFLILAAGKMVFQEFYLISSQKIKRRSSDVSLRELQDFVDVLKRDIWHIVQLTNLDFWLNLFCYIVPLFAFVMFVYMNGSIVVGDKSAHEATIHFPQLFYFSLFTLIFSWPHFAAEIFNFLLYTRRHKVAIITSLVVILLVIHFNTLVHPYLVADNRHYIFYIWNRFYGRYVLFRYLMAPVYLFALFVIIKKLSGHIPNMVMTLVCITVVLIPQRLIEVRYFFVPYVLFRLNLKSNSYIHLLLELTTAVLINFITLNTFFTKTIFWVEFDHPQRIIW